MENRNASIESKQVCYQNLEAWLRVKAQGFIQEVLEEEIAVFLSRGKHDRREKISLIDPPKGSRNGYGKPRHFSLLNGTVTVKRPRVRDLAERFESKILPLFKRKTEEVGKLLPELYLHGLSCGDFELALRGLLGEGAPLSASSIQRLKAKFELEYDAWKKSDLSTLEIVYAWADGLYVKAGIEDRKAALLVIIGAKADGEKVLLACESGERESKESWLTIFRDLKSRGLKLPPLMVADGHLGIWSALGEIHPSGQEQRCWNHKTMNVLDALPKKEQEAGKELLREIVYAPTLEDCEKKRMEFSGRYRASASKAVETLDRDWERMVTFYSFPKEHWVHLRTTNIVESPFNAVRLRTDAARRFKRVEGAKAIIWKTLQIAEKSWRKLNSPELLPLVLQGEKFKDGKRKEKEKESEEKNEKKRVAA